MGIATILINGPLKHLTNFQFPTNRGLHMKFEENWVSEKFKDVNERRTANKSQ